MKFFGVTFLETAVTGVIGTGESGIASRCIACRARPGMRECNGFGEGCLTQREAEPASGRPNPRPGGG